MASTLPLHIGKWSPQQGETFLLPQPVLCRCFLPQWRMAWACPWTLTAPRYPQLTLFQGHPPLLPLILHKFLHCPHGPFSLLYSSSSSKPQDKLCSYTGSTHPHTPIYSLTPSPLPVPPAFTEAPVPHSTLGTIAHYTLAFFVPTTASPGGPRAPPGQRLRSCAPPNPSTCRATWRHLERFDVTAKAPVNVPVSVSISDPGPSGRSWHNQPNP